MESVKVVLVGDGGVGKTCLMIQWSTGEFPTDYVPSVYDNLSLNRMVDGTATNVGIWDTAGYSDFDRLRPLSYMMTDLFVVCADLSDVQSQESIKEKWLPELEKFSPGVPFIIVGTKLDKARPTVVNASEEMLKIAKTSGARGYFECSALEEFGTLELLESCSRMALQQRRNGHKKRRKICLKSLISSCYPSAANTNNVSHFVVQRYTNEAFEPQLRDCGICFEAFPALECRRMRCCKERYCKNCLSTYVTQLAEEGRLLISCPNKQTCSKPLDSATLRAWGGDECYAVYKKNLIQAHAQHLTVLRETRLKQKEELINPSGFVGTKVCPTCSVIIYKYEGCSNVSCKCGGNFNWDTAESVF